MRYAFKLAQSRPRKRVDGGHQAERAAPRHGDVDEIAAEVSKEFPDVSWDKMLVDAMTVRMVKNPQSLDTIVATNLHADILSDWQGRWPAALASRRPAISIPNAASPRCRKLIHGEPGSRYHG